ncbi:MAG: polysaccharide biosynthesis C-terminal domain-containing protein [Planctomycetia bacterium]|nr:polysaccharide biosynthesis C-terminal domain-containing protein [Planctomycetia bacterium]
MAEVTDPALPADAAGAKPAVRPSAARSTLEIFATRVVSFPLTLGTGFLVAGVLGAAEQGVYTFLMLLGGFVLPLMSFGFGAAIVYFIANKRYAARDVYLTCLGIGLLQGVANAGIVAGLWYFDFLGNVAHGIPGSLMVPILLVLPLQGVQLMITRILLGDSWFSLNNHITVASPLLLSTLLLILVVAAGWGVEGAVASVVWSNFLVVCGLVVASIRRYRPALTWDWRFVWEGYHYGVRAWFGDLAIRANLRADQLLLSFTGSSVELGVYSIAVKISELLWFLPDSLAFVLFNKIAAEKSEEGKIALTARAHRAMLATMALLGLAVTVVGFWAIPFFFAFFKAGKDYTPAAVYLALLMPGTVLFTTMKVITKYFAASGMPTLSSAVLLIGAVFGIVLYFVLVPWYGAAGAAIASSVGYIATAAASVVLYQRQVRPNPTHLFAFRADDLWWIVDQCRRAFRRTRPAA